MQVSDLASPQDTLIRLLMWEVIDQIQNAKRLDGTMTEYNYLQRGFSHTPGLPWQPAYTAFVHRWLAYRESIAATIPDSNQYCPCGPSLGGNPWENKHRWEFLDWMQKTIASELQATLLAAKAPERFTIEVKLNRIALALLCWPKTELITPTISVLCRTYQKSYQSILGVVKTLDHAPTFVHLVKFPGGISGRASRSNRYWVESIDQWFNKKAVRQPVEARDAEGRLVHRFSSLSACIAHGYSLTAVSRASLRDNNQYKGLFWSRPEAAEDTNHG